jgi:iron(III) transport system ATP-binding protein
MSVMEYLELRHITKRYGKVVAVNELSLSIKQGTLVTLLGPSGCGKTTTLHILAGFTQPDKGEIYLNGRLINHLPPHRRGMSLVFQSYALFPHMTVYDNIAYGLKIRRLPRNEIWARVNKIMHLVGLQGLEKRYPHQLSGGQQQRVALARALVVEPYVLLLDEPLSNLDAKLRIAVRTEIRRLQRAMNITIVYVTHDQEEALSISDFIALMHQGHIVQFGTPYDLYCAPASQFVADFIGGSNFISGSVTRCTEKECEFSIGKQILIGRIVNADLCPKMGNKVIAAIRPEHIILHLEPPQKDINILEGEIIDTAFLGAKTRVWVRVPNQEAPFIVDIPTVSTVSDLQNKRCWLSIHPSNVIIVEAL